MNLELEVKRFNNEDVIVTSLCAHLSAYDEDYYGHMKVIAPSASGVFPHGIEYDPITTKNGIMLEFGTNDDYWIPGEDEDIVANINAPGWYHWDSNLGKYVYCTNQSDSAHPILEEE